MSRNHRLEAVVTGEVQAVGFRYWTRIQAEQLGLAGSAVNRDDGAVDIVAEGPEPALQELLRRLRSGSTPGRVAGVEAAITAASEGLTGFQGY
ncbi:acylphosphatase [Arthrobacter sp. TMN-37]